MVKTQKVKEYFDAGCRQKEIASLLNASTRQIRRHMRKAGIKPRVGRPPSRPMGERISYARAGVV